MCVVPKRFRIQFRSESFVQSVKLNRRKIRYIINHKKKGESCKTIAIDLKISTRRVEQIWKEYNETGNEPVIGKNLGRPKKPLNPEEVEIIKEAPHKEICSAVHEGSLLQRVYPVDYYGSRIWAIEYNLDIHHCKHNLQ